MRAVGLGCVGLLLCLAGAGQGLGEDASTIRLELKPQDLYGGLEARKVVLAADGAKISLDKRVFTAGKEKSGVIITDVIDAGPVSGIIAVRAKVNRISVKVDGIVPDEGAVAVEYRTGALKFDQSKWSAWTPVEKLSGVIEKPEGRYLQLRLTLSAKQEAGIPSVIAVIVESEFAREAGAVAGLKVTDSKIEQIVRSPIDFKYERPDNAKLVAFRKAINLDEVMAEGKTDFEKLVLLMDWTASCNNARTEKKEMTPGFYSWDIDHVTTITEPADKDNKEKKIGKASIHGHCMSYAEVMVSAATAMGFKARHMAVEGFKQASHEVSEVWVPSLRKWVYFDPSLSNYYFDKDTKEPLNIIQQHDIVARTFVPDGKDMNWFTIHKNEESRALVKKIGGKTPVGSRLGKWNYGKPMPENYDWGWSHGYLADGFVQMTPRNDFNSNPAANPKQFGNYPGYADYPFWVDAKTPPRKGVNNWYTRMRDFYWTLDQASLVLSAGAGDGKKLDVEFGNSMPFFKSYQVQVDGQPVAVTGNQFVWNLKQGANKLEVAPVDEFGQTGAASSVTVTCD